MEIEIFAAQERFDGWKFFHAEFLHVKVRYCHCNVDIKICSNIEMCEMNQSSILSTFHQMNT